MTAKDKRIAGLEAQVTDLKNRVAELEGEADQVPIGPVPPGTYTAELVDVERKLTRSSRRTFWQFQYRLVGSPYAGFPVWHNVMPRYSEEIEDVIRAFGLRVDREIPPELSAAFDQLNRGHADDRVRVEVGLERTPFGGTAGHPGRQVNVIRSVMRSR